MGEGLRSRTDASAVCFCRSVGGLSSGLASALQGRLQSLRWGTLYLNVLEVAEGFSPRLHVIVMVTVLLLTSASVALSM